MFLSKKLNELFRFAEIVLFDVPVEVSAESEQIPFGLEQ